MENVFVIIKPDAIRRRMIGFAIEKFEDVGLNVMSIEVKQPTETWCRSHYEGLADPAIYARVRDFMCGNGSLIGIAFEGTDGIAKARKIMGSQVDAALGTIRSFRLPDAPGEETLVHVSDSMSEAARELKLWRTLK